MKYEPLAKIRVFTIGGSIDKIYDPKQSTFVINQPAVRRILGRLTITLEYTITPLLKKDSLDITDSEREGILKAVSCAEEQKVLITHGTDTMIETAKVLSSVREKTIVLTGAMQPAACVESDAEFNLGCAFLAVQTLPPGVYLVMHGRVYDPNRCMKDVDGERFIEID